MRRGDERSALIEYSNLEDSIRWYPCCLEYPQYCTTWTRRNSLLCR